VNSFAAEPAQEGQAAGRPGGRVRTTRQSEAVDAVLRESDGFRTAQDLHAELRRRGDPIGLTTVYRHLNLLAESGEIDVVHGQDGEAQFRLCGAAAAPSRHHHHLVCRACGRAVEVDGPEVEAWAATIARQAGYTQVTHTVEIFGLCPEHS
jgi:Fur family ferric uptake transcriptional regulator